jgi:phosphinothricin acetyltransferase
MAESDWPDAGRIYQAGMDTNLATFQAECPSWKEWSGSHLPQCRLVVTAGKTVSVGAPPPYRDAASMPRSEVSSLSIRARREGVGTRLLPGADSGVRKQGY